MLSMRSIARDDPDRYALSVVNQLLGGGMSSRLFQEVRERRGLAYSVYAYRAAYETTGSMSVYAGTAPERVAETLQVIRDELAKLVVDGVSDDELVAAKGHLKGSTTLALETSSSRMHRLGRSAADAGRGAVGRRASSPRSTRSRSTDLRRVIDAGLRDRRARALGRRAAARRRLRCRRPFAPSAATSASACHSSHGRRVGSVPRMIRVGVFGAGGRMGATVCAAVA